MNIRSFSFPTQNAKNVCVLCIALAANGSSSYRDAISIVTLARQKWIAQQMCIITDNPARFPPMLTGVSIIHVSSAIDVLHNIEEFVKKNNMSTADNNLLFTLSAHGYSMCATPARKAKEMNRRSEYIQVNQQKIYDYQLFSALYKHMHSGVYSLCLIDTCHAGTMLDMEYLSRNGGLSFQRSKTILKQRPFSVCISVCNDNETAGEDISAFGGWGGKLICWFLDHVHTNGPFSFHVLTFFSKIYNIYTTQKTQRTHPVISYNE